MEKVMTSMQGTLLLQQRMSVKMTSVAPLSTSRSQHSGDSLVAISAHNHTHTHTECFTAGELFYGFARGNMTWNMMSSGSAVCFFWGEKVKSIGDYTFECSKNKNLAAFQSDLKFCES